MKATRQACRAAERPILRGLTIEAPTFRHPRTGKSLPCVLLPNALSSAIAREAIASLAASTATLQAAVESAHDGSGHVASRRVARSYPTGGVQSLGGLGRSVAWGSFLAKPAQSVESRL
jgi:hypothetical protein